MSRFGNLPHFYAADYQRKNLLKKFLTYGALPLGIGGAGLYGYNQIMHRLDLEDPRLLLPVPIYDLGSRGRPERFADKRALRMADGNPKVAFFAYDRPAPGTVPVWWSGAACGKRRLLAGGRPATAPLFHAYTGEDRPAALRTRPLGESPLAFVLESPLHVRLPVSAYLSAPTADAGLDRCLREERTGAGVTTVLDGTATHGIRTLDARYTWSWQGGSASGRRTAVQLPAGLHDVRLEVATPDGLTASDTALSHSVGGLRQRTRFHLRELPTSQFKERLDSSSIAS